MDEASGSFVVHQYGAAQGPNLRVHWQPEFHRPGGSVQHEGGEPILCSLPREKTIANVELHSRVLTHASARKLESAKWRIDSGVLEHGAVVVAARCV